MKTIYDFPLDRIRRRQIRLVSAGAATEYINSEIVKPGDLHVVTRVAVVNETTGFSQLRVGVWDGANFHLAEEQKSPSSDTLYWTTDSIYLSESENLRIELQGCTAGDIITAYVDSFLRRV